MDARAYGWRRLPLALLVNGADLNRRLHELSVELGEPMTLDGLTRDFKIFQRRRGHRHSTDDLLTAWYATQHAPAAVGTMLDLGTGIGSVGLSLAWYFRDAALTVVEVQERSFRLCIENVWANGLEHRVRAIHGDLRDAVPDDASYDLVTGSPPYFDPRTGIVSADPQRAGARFELCGDVADYCRVAAARLAEGGRFVFCFPTQQRARAEAACAKARLEIVAARDVVPKEGLAPLFSLFACRRPSSVSVGPEGGARPTQEPPFVVRDRDGAHTDEMTAARRTFGNGS